MEECDRMVSSERAAEILFDKITGIPLFYYYLDEASSILRKQHCLGLIYISLGNIVNIEEEYGTEIYEKLLSKIGEVINSLSGQIVRSGDFIGIAEVEADSFVIFLNQRRTPGHVLPTHLEAAADRVYRFIAPKIYDIVRFYTAQRPKVAVGFQLVIYNPMVREKRSIYRSIADARKAAEYHAHKMSLRMKQEIENLIQDPSQLTTEYQPIVELSSKEIMGYEALTRGPKDTELYDANFLFAVAEEVNLISQLDHICRKLSLEKINKLNQGHKLFINIYPMTIHDPESQREELMKLLDQLKLAPKSIVLEVGERHLIKSFALFGEAAKHYTDLGFSISVDDAGTGYASLQMISSVRPKFIKIDISIIRDIHTDRIKRELVKALKEIGESIGADLIAEGIEKKEELDLLRDLGIRYGQGFYLARPSYPPVEEI